jgi:hypothetical protein
MASGIGFMLEADEKSAPYLAQEIRPTPLTHRLLCRLRISRKAFFLAADSPLRLVSWLCLRLFREKRSINAANTRGIGTQR